VLLIPIGYSQSTALRSPGGTGILDTSHVHEAALAILPADLRLATNSTAQPMPWTGEAQGGVFIQRHRDNNNSSSLDRVIVDDQQNYQAHFNFSFQIVSPGRLVGTGNGSYDAATWHLQGTNDNQSFSCDPPITADPFTVALGGNASKRNITLNLALPDAVESNVNWDCGANFTAYGGSSQYLTESLQKVGGTNTTFNMTTPGSNTLKNRTETNSGEFTDIITESSWKITVKHDCAGSDYSQPQSTVYINQYAAGAALNLPEAPASAGGQRGGNACGPSSLVMLINAAKQAANNSARMSLTDVYNSTMTNGWVQDGVSNLFDWDKARAWAQSKGFYAALGSGVAFVNSSLTDGFSVLASTRFSSKPQSSDNPYGAGHVILFTGRTTTGDYIVSDPAGDYMSSDSGHYGSGSCGANVLYPKAIVEARLLNSDNSSRPALAIENQSGADPQYLLVIGWYSGMGPSPYRLWVQDGTGHRSGFVPGGGIAQEIPNSEVGTDPQYESNPDALPGPAPNSSDWPESVSLPIPAGSAGLQVFLQGVTASNYHVEVYIVGNGIMSRDSFTDGNVSGGQTVSFPVAAGSTASGSPGLPWVYIAVGSVVAVVAAGAVVVWIRRRGPKDP